MSDRFIAFQYLLINVKRVTYITRSPSEINIYYDSKLANTVPRYLNNKTDTYLELVEKISQTSNKLNTTTKEYIKELVNKTVSKLVKEHIEELTKDIEKKIEEILTKKMTKLQTNKTDNKTDDKTDDKTDN